MINLPHIGLYGDLSACEDGMIDALNRNFSLLDAIVQLKVLDFVTELPEDPEKGDVYILNTPLDTSTDKDLMIFNGTNWVQIIPQDGFIAYIDSQESFYYYNDGEWVKDLTDLSELKLKLARATSTGVIDGLNLSTTVGDNTKFDVAAGIYEIVDLSDVNNPDVKTIQYAGSTGNVVTNLATHDVTYISLDEDGVIHQSINFPTPNERRSYAFVGRLNHTNRASISFADTFPDFKLSPVSSLYDLMDALAPFKMDHGLKTTPNGVNLSFDVSAGKVFFRSDNYTTDKNNPHTKSFTSQVLAPFRKMTQTSTVDATDVTVLEPSYYDVAGTRTIIAGGPNHATIQRIYKYKSGAIRVAYGQNIYTNISAAREAVNFDSFVENPTINQTAVLIALVIITKGCTDLSDPSQCVILPASRFGSVSGGGGGGAGSGVMVVADLAARNNIPEGTRTNGMLVQVISEDAIYKLIGLPSGATTTDANWDHVITGKATQVITNKDIDGGTASNNSRLTIPKGTASDLNILNRKEGTIAENTESKQIMLDDGNKFNAIPKFGNTDTMFVDIAANEVLAGWTQTFTGSTATLTRSTSTDVAPYAYRLANALSDNLGTLKLTRLVDVPKGFNGQRLNISFDYASTILDGFGLSVYDMTNPAYIIGYDNSDAYKIPAANIPTKANYVFDVPLTCTQIRIELHKKLGFDLVGGVFSFNNTRIGKWSPNVAITEGPRSLVKFNNGGNRGSTNTNVVYYTNITQQEGTGVSAVNTAALGTEVHIKRSGIVTVTATRNQPVSTSGSQIVKNQTTYNISHPAEDILAGYTGSSGAGVALQFSGQARVVAGDIIRVVSENNTGAANNNNTLSVVLHEDNLAARFADYTLNQDVSFVGFRAASQAASTTVNVKVDSVKDTVGAWDAVNGEYEVKSAGDTDIEMTAQTSTSGGAFVYKNGTNTGYFIGASWGANGVISGSVTIPNCIVGDKLSIRLNASFNLTNTYLSFSKRATSQQLFTPIAQRYVVKTYQSGTSWYEVYNDGWVRQGDYINTGTDSSRATTLVIPMKDANYEPRTTIITTSNSSPTWEKVGFSAISSTQVTLWAGSVLTKKWSVEGYGNAAAVKALGANPSYA